MWCEYFKKEAHNNELVVFHTAFYSFWLTKSSPYFSLLTREVVFTAWWWVNRYLFYYLLQMLSTSLYWLTQEDAQEESGWKQVHGDVFRPPRKGMLLSVFLGQGTQIFIMTFITLCKDCFFSQCFIYDFLDI